MATIDPIFPAVIECWRALSALESAAVHDAANNGAPPAAPAALARYHGAWAALLATHPITLDGVAALARMALDLSSHMDAEDYLHEAITALSEAGAPPTPAGPDVSDRP